MNLRRPCVILHAVYVADDDRELALAAASGDGAAFAVLPDRHDDGLSRLCFRLAGRRETAGDLPRDICLALSAKLQNFRGEAKLTTWPYRVTASTPFFRRTSGSGT